MKIKFFFVLAICFIATSVFAQSNLKDYKYVVVPNKFDFLKEQDQYQLNSLAKFLFNKYGFEAILEGDEYPEGLALNRCLGLKTDVSKENGFLKTKLIVKLKDCNNVVVFTSEIGESRDKNYAKAYTQALRSAFKSIEGLNHKYIPNKKTVTVKRNTVVKTPVLEEVEQLKQQIEVLKSEKQNLSIKENKTEKLEKLIKTTKVASGNVLYAQEINNGFQLVDSSPKVVLRIKQTQLAHVFLVENKQAIVYKKGEVWFMEYYTDNVLKQEVLNIKF